MDFEEKKIIKSIIYSRISLVVIFILLVLVAKGAWNAYSDAKITQGNRKSAEIQFAELEKRESDILFEIEQLNTQEGKEKEIRSKFSVVKEGENMIMIVDPKDDNQKENDNENAGIWKKFLNLFRN
ncbi:septum formation initiator family protein [Candidatus Parcubacteria bacterium]|nr:septum formation initiator family protein [Candidatus Parcubacteria bacterium]